MSIVWIVLPNGLQTRALRASIYVSPRLAGPTLAGTPFANWPDTLAGLTFRVASEPNGSTFNVTPDPLYDSSLWTKVFGAASVSPFVFKDQVGRAVWSYSVARAKSFIDSVYAAVQSGSPTDYPSVDPNGQSTLITAIGQANTANRLRTTRGREPYNTPRKSPTAAGWTAAALTEQALAATLPGSTQTVYLAKRFFDRPASESTKDSKGYHVAKPRPLQPVFDFHQKLALLADHPYLLRKLGLVLDVHLSLGAGQVPDAGYLRFGAFNVQGVPMPDCIYPRTAYETVGMTVFRAYSPGSSNDVREGFVPLEDPKAYLTTQGEPDGDIHKFVGFATNVALLTSALTREAGEAVAPPPQSVPARRSAGFYVARNDRAAALKSRFGVNAGLEAALNSPTPPDLFAADLLRGYRVDVKTSTSPWFSLHKRRITYAYGLGTPTPIGSEVADEAYLKANSGTSDPSPDGPPDLYLHEVIFGWEGWSLATPRPGRRLMPVYAKPDDAIAAPDDSPSADFPLHAPVRSEPGSLIPLRFSYPYSFRMRAVDLAGNSLPPTDPTTTHSTPLQTYKRYEPVVPPTLVLRWPVTEGESVEHLVIRSGEGMGADAYAAHLNTLYADPKFPQKVYRATAERHVAAPKTSQAFAEAHGDFDGAFADKADTKAFFRLATREEGTFADKRIPSLTVDNGYIDGNPNQAAIVTPPQVPLDQRRAADGASDVSSLTQNRGDALAPGEYVVCGVSDAVLPYLPDSAAGGTSFYDPATNAVLLTANWKGIWPDWAPFRLQLAEGTAVNGGAVVGRVGTITLPPATILSLDYSSLPALDRLSHLAYIIDYGITAADALTGRHWMLTPRRQVVLVHAVPQPLSAPLASVTVGRGIDATYVSHVGKLVSHSRSTNHVDLEASWNETLDVPSKPLPDDGVSSPTIAQSGPAYQVPVTYGTDEQPIRRLRHEFHDTKHRIVKYTPVAHTRYKEYFPPALVADASKITLAGTAPGPRSDGTFSIPSSSRPVVPKVLYVVPTFRWEASSGASLRRGGGLRVYLERPWYTTGEGELLAVVLANSNNAAPVDVISRWGRDPFFADGVASALRVTNFVSPTATVKDFQLADGTSFVDLAAYAVEFNAERKLWFCDVLIDPGTAYFPFVSLSLARYQPESLKTVELSTPVRADFAQLTADRALTFKVASDSVHLELTGVVSPNAAEGLLPAIPMPDANSRRRTAPSTHRIVGYVQQRSPGSVGEMGWSVVGGETVFAGSRELSTPVATWVADVPIPAAANPPRERRVVIEEREYYQADQLPLFRIKGLAPVDFRVVYLDTVALP